MRAVARCETRFEASELGSHHVNVCVETYENMHNVRNDVWWAQNARLVQRKTKRTILGRVNFAPRIGPLRNCHG